MPNDYWVAGPGVITTAVCRGSGEAALFTKVSRPILAERGSAMSIERRIDDLIEAGWGVVDSDFDPFAFITGGEALSIASRLVEECRPAGMNERER